MEGAEALERDPAAEVVEGEEEDAEGPEGDEDGEEGLEGDGGRGRCGEDFYGGGNRGLRGVIGNL